jgi:hypothetical protein
MSPRRVNDGQVSERVIEEQIQYYRRRAAELTAIDASPEAIEIARRRCPASVRFACADILRWTPDRRYDPPRLAAHLDALGWDCELEVDGEDWVIGRARARE